MAVGRGDEARGHVVAEEPIELSRYGAPLLRSHAASDSTDGGKSFHARGVTRMGIAAAYAPSSKV